MQEALLATIVVLASPPALRPLVGINYFAGWWHGAGDKWFDPRNASLDWRPLYPERVPLLGEYNSQGVMDAEINAAAAHGVDFFQFLWYDPYPSERAPNAAKLNRGVLEFTASANAPKMRFFIEWCNAHPLFTVHNESEWRTMVMRDWVPAMKHPSYLRVGGALLFKVHDAGSFLKYGCGGNRTLAGTRLDYLRSAVRGAGLGEMVIGAGAAPRDMTAASWWATDCAKRNNNGGQDGTCYDWVGLYCALDHDDPAYEGMVLPWANESAYVSTNRAQHATAHGVPFVPVVVSGWDPRPWHEARASFAFPSSSEWTADLRRVQADLVSSARGGISNLGLPLLNGSLQPVFNIYAWNEFAEGGIMAPSVGWNYSRLEAIKDVFGPP